VRAGRRFVDLPFRAGASPVTAPHEAHFATAWSELGRGFTGASM
jgi:hypothetical protein